MPKKLTRIDLQKVRYVSMVDFMKRIDEIEDIDDKRRFAAQYLVRHGIDTNNPDYSLAEATHIAKMKIAEASIKAKEKFYEEEDAADYYIGDVDGDDRKEVVNPYAEDYENDVANEYFMGHASDYLNHLANDLADAEAPTNENDIQERIPMDQYLNSAARFTPELEKDIIKLDAKPNALDVKIRIDAKLGRSGALNDLYNKTKPSFGASFFRTTSRASKNLDAAYKAFNNPNHAMYGDLATIEKAGIEYLEHKIPGWKRGMELPTEEQINRLSGTSKARALLSVNLINAAREQKGVEQGLREVVGEANHNQYRWNEVTSAEKPFLAGEEEELDKSNSSDDSIVSENSELDNSNSSDNSEIEEEDVKEEEVDEKEEFLKDIAKEDAKTSLKELKEGEQMNLHDEEFVEPEPDPDEEEYAFDDDPLGLNDTADMIKNDIDELGESWLDEKEVKRMEEWKKQQAFQEGLREELEGYDDLKVEINTEEQEKAYANGTLKDPKPDPQENDVDYPEF